MWLANEVVVGYLKWYYRVSHPWLVVPTPQAAQRALPIPNYDAGPSDPRMSFIVYSLHWHIDHIGVDEDNPDYVHLFRALHLARSD